MTRNIVYNLHYTCDWLIDSWTLILLHLIKWCIGVVCLMRWYAHLAYKDSAFGMYISLWVCAWTCVKFTITRTKPLFVCEYSWPSKAISYLLNLPLTTWDLDVLTVSTHKNTEFVPFTFVCKTFAELWAECWVVASSSSLYRFFKK